MKIDEKSLMSKVSFNKSKMAHMDKEEMSYISPDDGLPNKRLKDIFDRSNTQMQEVTESEIQDHNSLYYLFENQSQVRGINKPLDNRYYAANGINLTNT